MTLQENALRLTEIQYGDYTLNAPFILNELKKDQVFLVKNVPQEAADGIVAAIADKLSLRDKMETQAAFSSFLGHRERLSNYFMSVNRRGDYQFIPPHSEGIRRINVQIVAFYCYYNETDGGETVFLNADQESNDWGTLREYTIKADTHGKRFSASEVALAKSKRRIYLPYDSLSNEDEILGELDNSENILDGAKIYRVKSKIKKDYSSILNKEVYVYWDSIASADLDCGREFKEFLERYNLLKKPYEACDVSVLDNSHKDGVWSSGVSFDSLFKAVLIMKLSRGDLVIHNNMTWAHSTNNWTPGSNKRKVAVAFA